MKEKKTKASPKTKKAPAKKATVVKSAASKKKVPVKAKPAEVKKLITDESAKLPAAAKKKAKLPGLMELLIDEADKPAAASGALPPAEKGKTADLPAPKDNKEKEIEEIDPESLTRGDHPMSIVDHLDEFRSRFLKIFLAFIIFTFVAFYFSDSIVYYINKPFLDTNNQLHIFKLTGGFMLRFKASAGTAILLLIPYLLFHAWRFIAPAIGKTERMFSRLTIISAVLLFYSGVAFVFFLLIPFSIKMFLSFIGTYMITTIGADDYLNMIFIFCLLMGILFEMPIIMLVLTKFGVVTPELLITKRKYAIVIIWVIAALVSPPDVISMVLCGIPLMGLYEISIVLSRFSLIRKKRRELAQK
ncbi:MAG TPA: twin-arginine translocase subunit TatC [Spirochaetota bacterium]|nr:twin-arginine translocase subunit TatC [Spirochaetota bacterium]